MKYFGTDGIRGVFPDFLNPMVAYKLGFALTKFFAGQKNKVILIGSDGRESGNCLETALAAGILAGGFDVWFLGVVSSCALAFLVKDVHAAGGVMVSASHNPAKYNGLKVFNNNAEKLRNSEEKQIEKFMTLNIINSKEWGVGLKPGKFSFKYNLKNKYIKFLRELFEKVFINKTGLKNEELKQPYVKSICIGGAYGGASEICKKVFSDLNIKVHFFGCEVAGEKINTEYSAVNMKKIQEEVVKTESDFGFCLDGDADRIISVDEKGNIIDGDKILFILSKYFLGAGLLKTKKVVGTNFSNTGIKQALGQMGIKFISTKVGDKFVIKKLLEINGEIGGEASGHIVMTRFLHTGDGVLAAIMLLNALEFWKKPLSKLTSEFKPFAYKITNIKISDKFKKVFKKDKEFSSFKKECEELLVASGRIVVRESGTEPVIRVLVEGIDEKLCNKVLEIVKKKIIEMDSRF